MARLSRKRELCPHCGQRMPLEHRHVFSEALLIGLKRLAKAGGGPVNLKHLGLTHSQWDNFQKLRYWSLAYYGDKSGEWRITELGRRFLRGKATIQRVVFTKMGNATRFDGVFLGIDSIMEGYRKRPDYARDARQVLPTAQGELIPEPPLGRKP